MRKQLAIIIDSSGSMFQPTGADSAHDKIVEASESVQWMVEEIRNRVSAGDDQWAVSIWRFANTVGGLVGQSMFSFATVSDAFVSAINGTVAAIEDQSSNQAAVGNLTDIFAAVHQVADWMDMNLPSFTPGGSLDKRSIILFTDGNQTIPHNGQLDRAGYETEHGVSFSSLLHDRGIVLNTQGIGSDLLNATLTDLVAQAAAGSSSKVISETGGYSTDVSAALMTNALKAVNDNGVLALRPALGPASGLLWEQFSLPGVELTGFGQRRALLSVPSFERINHKDFEVDVDGISEELILGVTWHQPAEPSVEAVSPSGSVLKAGVGGAYQIGAGWLFALHIPRPEEGTWRVRVAGDPKYRPVRVNLMARGINPAFDLWVWTDPAAVPKPTEVRIIASPRSNGKPASGQFTVTATPFGGSRRSLDPQNDGTYVATMKAERPGVTPIRIDLEGKLEDGRSVKRIEFTTVQVGRPRDPRLFVSPSEYELGQSYTVDVVVQDAVFDRLTQMRFGDGIDVKHLAIVSAHQARAQIEVVRHTWAGERELVSFHPDAETLSGIKVAEGERAKREVEGQIQCLGFDERGHLIELVMDRGRAYPVEVHSESLQRLLEHARDNSQRVSVRVDAEGRLCGLKICH